MDVCVKLPMPHVTKIKISGMLWKHANMAKYESQYQRATVAFKVTLLQHSIEKVPLDGA